MSGKPQVKPIQAFTGLRGLAALSVVAYHFRDGLAEHVPSFAISAAGEGFLAVDIFFILSGFVIYLNYRWMFDDFNMRSAKAFVVARFARIYPVHFFMSLLFLINPLTVLIFSKAKDLGSRYDLSYYFMNLLLVHNWGLTSRVEWNIPSWSISTEWFAYLMFPVFLMGIARKKKNPVVIVVEMLGLLAGLAAFFFFVGASSIGDSIPQFGLLRCLLEFLVGTGLCRFYLLTGTPGPRVNLGLLALVLGLIATTIGFSLPDYLLLPASFTLLILCLTSDRSLLCKALSWKPLLALGEISYSLYMVHYFVKDWVKFATPEHAETSLTIFFLYLALALSAATLLYFAVEKPGRQLFRSMKLKKV